MDLWLPALGFVVVAWFLGTGAVLWLDRQPAEDRPAGLLAATVAAAIGMAVVLVAREHDGPVAAMAAFAGALLLWAWHEASFLLGFVTGPRRVPLPEGATGWQRFGFATATLIHHEIALAATAVALLLLGIGHPNGTAGQLFALLFVLRLSTKVNIFLGVPHFADELLPDHLSYLRSYFRIRPTTVRLLMSLAATMALTALLATAAMAQPAASGAAMGYALLAVMAGLGALEHAFLMLPVRESALWRWAIPSDKAAR